MKKLPVIILAVLISINLIGCLAVETKEYSFKLKSGNSGEGKIKYINIMRTDDSASTIENDYEELISSYLRGSKPEDEMKGIKNIKKRLFEEDNRLCGEITFEFDDITALRFYKYNDETWCYYVPPTPMNLFGTNDEYFSSNGIYGGENMPVIFWNGKQKTFEFKTVVSQPEKNKVSLLDSWKKMGSPEK